MPMELAEPRFVPRSEVFVHRPERAERVRFEGLWLAGSLGGLERPVVAVVGTRAPSEAARQRARVLAEALGAAGLCVVSGLALGVDGAAHSGAVSAAAPTIGVLGGGHRHFFPRRNLALARSMLELDGAVLSPFPPDEPARPWQFLQRNGVVAALADAVVIVEAAERSGALNTASWAANFGIEVLAFPGDVERPKAAGCNALIRDGATLVRNACDVLEAMGVRCAAPSASARPERRVPHDALSAKVLALLSEGSGELESLIFRSGDEPGAILATLMKLEVAGEVASDGATFRLAP
jgi:DNA processing protein